MCFSVPDLSSVSCPSAGNCAAGGYSTDSNGHQQAFVITEKNGAWSLAAEVPGTGSLNADGLALATSVACVPSGNPVNCALGGRCQDKHGHAQAFVDLLKKGAWQKASAIATKHNVGGYAQASTVSCPAAGFCAAGGFYSDGHFGNTLPFTDDGAIT